MDRRLQLHEKLCDILGGRNVYFQPPEDVKLTYPCIIYKRGSDDTTYANNKAYRLTRRYDVQIIDYDPDTDYDYKMTEAFEMCRPGRRFEVDDLYHDNFTLYY